MTITNGQLADAGDIEKIVITYLEGINHLTTLSENASVTDRNYSYADTDVFSDSTGYNDTIDTGNTSAELITDTTLGTVYTNYTTYDLFEDASLDAGLWDTVDPDGDTQVAETGGSASASASNGKTASFASNDLPALGSLNVIFFSGRLVVNFAAPSGNATITFGAQNVDTHTGSSTDETHEYLLVKDGDDYDVYIDGVSSGTITPSDNVLKFSATGQASIGNTNSCSSQYVLYNPAEEDIRTFSKTFGSNIGSIFCKPNRATTNCRVTDQLTADYSTDGGSSFEKTDQAVDTVIALDGDDTDMVVEFNLGNTGGGEILSGYSYQVW